MSYPCQTCGKNTIVRDTRRNVRTRRCSSQHTEKSLELPLSEYNNLIERLCYLEALEKVIQPNLNLSHITPTPEPCKIPPNKRGLSLSGLSYSPPPVSRFRARVYVLDKRITLYYGPDLFLAACALISWKNKHDINNT